MTGTRPFLKWAGGKQRALPSLARFFPQSFEHYYEPFLGGGAVFFFLRERRFPAFLSDTNAELINTYQTVKSQVDELIEMLKVHQQNYLPDPKAYYCRVVAENPAGEVERAARFIFLNKTCYNGLYRVNNAGQFTVPFGRHKNPRICDAERLVAASKALDGAELKVADYSEALRNCAEGDLIYIDPPFVPESRTAYFTKYTSKGFTSDDQKRLAGLFRQLDAKGCIVVLSNSDTPLARTLYAGFFIESIPTLRLISSVGATRAGRSELVIHNKEGKP